MVADQCPWVTIEIPMILFASEFKNVPPDVLFLRRGWEEKGRSGRNGKSSALAEAGQFIDPLQQASPCLARCDPATTPQSSSPVCLLRSIRK